MTSMPELERGYHRLVACYPRSFRGENEEEIVAVLLATALPGQRRPGVAESLDLLRGAVRMRMGLTRAPRTVVTAVRLMCLGAVAEIATLITVLLSWGSIRSAATQHYPGHASLVARLVNDDVTKDVVVLTILVAAWLLVAWGNGRGNQWARLAAIVLAPLYTVDLGSELSQGVAALAPAAMIASAVAWALGVAAVAFLLRSPSWPYYERQPAIARQAAPL
jgi:hypothetical protein